MVLLDDKNAMFAVMLDEGLPPARMSFGHPHPLWAETLPLPICLAVLF